MTVTAWGECGGPSSAAANYDRYGRMTGARSYRELELWVAGRGIEIDADHDAQRLGELIHVELGDDWLTNVDQPVHFSPTLRMRGHGIDASDTYIARTGELIGLSVTLATARVGLRELARV